MRSKCVVCKEEQQQWPKTTENCPVHNLELDCLMDGHHFHISELATKMKIENAPPMDFHLSNDIIMTVNVRLDSTPYFAIVCFKMASFGLVSLLGVASKVKKALDWWQVVWFRLDQSVITEAPALTKSDQEIREKRRPSFSSKWQSLKMETHSGKGGGPNYGKWNLITWPHQLINRLWLIHVNTWSPLN